MISIVTVITVITSAFYEVAFARSQQKDLSVFVRVKLSSVHITHGGSFTLSSYNAEGQPKTTANTNFSGFWLNPARNGNRIYPFSSRSFIYSPLIKGVGRKFFRGRLIRIEPVLTTKNRRNFEIW